MEDILLKQMQLQLFEQHLKFILHPFFQTDSGECYHPLTLGETSFSDTKREPPIQRPDCTLTQY